jgi:REP element-mobilizing transposase RayT
MSRLRRLVLSDRFFFLSCRVLPTRRNLSEPEFATLAQVMSERRKQPGFLLTAWVFLPDHWHAIVFPRSPLTNSRVVEAIKVGATLRINRRRDRACCLQDRERGLQPALTRTHLSAGRIAALLLTPPRNLSATQRTYCDSFLRFCPAAYKGRKLALQFRAMLRWRRSGRLVPWIKMATGSGFPRIAQFARTLRRDLHAVELAVTEPPSLETI